VRDIRLILQYDGTDFCGYELQPGKRTIRGEIEKALEKIYKKPVKFYAASRTDSGVHALGNVVSFKVKTAMPAGKIPVALNSVLPEDIRVIKAEAKAARFNARFSAKSKEYEYLIFNGQVMPPHLRTITWQVKSKLNLASMKKAAKYLVGRHDFSSFCASGGDDRNFVRIIHSLVVRHSSLVIWTGHKCRVMRLRVKGNGFLYKMVRNIVGTLVEVGLSRLKVNDVRKIIKGRDRRLAGRTAPAQGLCLLKVNY